MVPLKKVQKKLAETDLSLKRYIGRMGRLIKLLASTSTKTTISTTPTTSSAMTTAESHAYSFPPQFKLSNVRVVDASTSIVPI